MVTRAADAHLLRFFLASYERFWEGGNRLVLFTRRSDSYLWEDIRLPAATHLVYREDFPELGEDDFRNQLYLKLTAHRFVETENYVFMDSDFLFVAPCPESVFFNKSKPIWFRRAWDDVAVRWREGSEAFVGKSIEHLYMSAPQYVFSRTIAAELCRRYDPRRILAMDGVSEYVVYGWFARQFFADSYHWVDLPESGTAPVGRLVNQTPPSYCELDPKTSLDDFPEARYVVFWSHWDLAEAKMAEFLLEAHRRYPGRPLHLPETSRIYPLIHLPASPQALYYNIRGLYSDGWVKDDVWFAADGAPPMRRMRIQFDVPQGPVTGSWQLSCGSQNEFQLDAGLAELTIPLNPDGARHSVLLSFDSPESGLIDSTGRSLRARLLDVSLDDEADTSTEENLPVAEKNRMITQLSGTVKNLRQLLEVAAANADDQHKHSAILEAAGEERLAQLLEKDRAMAELRSQLELAAAHADDQHKRSALLESASEERLAQLLEKDRVMAELRSQLELAAAHAEEQHKRSEMLEAASQERLAQLLEKDRAMDELRSQLELAAAHAEEQHKRSEMLESASQERLAQLLEKDRALDELRGQLELAAAHADEQHKRSEMLESASQERLAQLLEKDRALDELRSQLELAAAHADEQHKQVAEFQQVIVENKEQIRRIESARDHLAEKAEALRRRIQKLEAEGWRDYIRRRLG